MGINPVSILLAEDDDGHATLVQRNLRRAGLVNEIVRVHDGREALQYVYGEGIFAGRDPGRPLLILLDINMPVLNGVEVLRQIKSDPSTEHLPVIMLTTTDDPREVDRCYKLKCSIYVTKPVEYDAFVEAVRRLGLFLGVVAVPSDSHSICA